MANIGTALAGKTLIGAGNTSSPIFADIGTNSNLTDRGVLIARGTGAFAATAAGVSGQLLQSKGAAINPAYTTSTYPSTNAINTLLYASATDTMSALPTANQGVLTTGATGTPSIDTTNFHVLSTGVQMRGNNTLTPPPVGFIGERLNAVAGVIPLTTDVTVSAVSIVLTPGIWDMTAAVTSTCSVALVGVTMGIGKILNSLADIFPPNNGMTSAAGGTLQSTLLSGWRESVNANTTYYLNLNVGFSGTCSANARITAVRVG